MLPVQEIDKQSNSHNTSANPANNSSARSVYKSLGNIKENGSGHFDATLDMSTLDWSSYNNNYVGLDIQNNANTGCTATFSNVKVVVY